MIRLTPDQCDRLPKCRLIEVGMESTEMYSPIVYNAAGEPVSGGSNITCTTFRCQTCNRFFEGRQTDFDRVIGNQPQWTEI